MRGCRDRIQAWVELHKPLAEAVVDLLRAAVPEVIAQCRAAGIRVVMITGDAADRAGDRPRGRNPGPERIDRLPAGRAWPIVGVALLPLLAGGPQLLLPLHVLFLELLIALAAVCGAVPALATLWRAFGLLQNAVLASAGLGLLGPALLASLGLLWAQAPISPRRSRCSISD